jgi:hypothetical protein
VYLAGLIEFVGKLEKSKNQMGRPASLVHNDVPSVPNRLYVQVSVGDLKSLVMPPTIELVLAKRLKINNIEGANLDYIFV